MFQYAAGRALSLERGEMLKLDVSAYSGYARHHGFELNKVFNGCADIASEFEIKEMLGWQSSSFVRRIFNRRAFSSIRRHGYVVEPHFQYWDGFEKISDNCYLYGYWQSEKYFLKIQKIIRKDFSFQTPLDGVNAEMANKMSTSNAVSIHVRRGDYVANSYANRMHGTCSLTYYADAIRYIAQRITCPQFFVFSDEIEWVKQNLPIDWPCQYVSHNQGDKSFNDMHLMSLCKHHIIANSSFSWWGAWLNADVNKIVIAPKRWFAIDRNTSDLIPVAWVTL